jgi:ethanolamine-phosphate cytidylyltransferase
MRQAAGLADELYVGLHNDEEIARNKGPPLFTLAERMELVSA